MAIRMNIKEAREIAVSKGVLVNLTHLWCKCIEKMRIFNETTHAIWWLVLVDQLAVQYLRLSS